jgi:heat shock protein HtpX
MAMLFWEAKRKQRLRTIFFITVFLILACAVSLLFEVAIRYFAKEGYTPPMPYLGFVLFGFICVVAIIYYASYATFGGSLAPESMGGVVIERNDPINSAKEIELLNIVEEISIASRLPMPKVYLINAEEINAFAAGLHPEKSVIAVTTGALRNLSREELQGVIAHEFGHIASGDMRVGMRLAALLMGFFLVFYIGMRLLEGSLLFGRGNGRRGNSLPLIALLLLVAGVVLWFAGNILRACVSRAREYNADASAVEFTRNPYGIAGALKKIQVLNNEVQDMPKSGMGYGHLYLDNRSFWCRLFATHPSLDKRIAALLGEKEKQKKK